MGKPNYEEKRHIMTAFLNASTTVETDGQYANVPFNANVSVGKGKLTFDASNNAIKIGKGVSKVKIDAVLNMKSRGANFINGIYVYKNNTAVGQCLITFPSTGDYYQVSIIGKILDVAKDDLINLAVRTVAASSADVTINGTTQATQTSLTVEVLE